MALTANILLLIVICQHIYIRRLKKEINLRDRAYDIKSKKEAKEIINGNFEA